MSRLPEPTPLVNGADAPVPPIPTRARGRPRKPSPPVDKGCTDPFDQVAAAVASIAPRVWPAARERVSQRADREQGLRPISGKVLRFLLEHVNRGKGYDWHPVEAIAKNLGVGVSAIEKGMAELVAAGFILRYRQPVKGGCKGTAWRWWTTIPALVKAAEEVASERKRPAEEPTQKMAEEPTQKIEVPTQECAKSPPKKSEEPTQERAVESIEEPLEESLPPYPPKRAASGALGGRESEPSPIPNWMWTASSPSCARNPTGRTPSRS